jgi:ribosomal protein S18 acetylase RimI-like enzyme
MSSSSAATELPTIRAVQACDWPIVRDVCVQMLLDSPEAFGETLAEAQSRDPSEWILLVERCAQGADMSAFFAEDDSGICGFVRANAADPRIPPGTVLVSQLWVAPRQRGKGLGRNLMNAVSNWAEERKASQISLGVAESNLGVQKFYEGLGYADTGIRAPLPSNTALRVVVLAKRIES